MSSKPRSFRLSSSFSLSISRVFCSFLFLKSFTCSAADSNCGLISATVPSSASTRRLSSPASRSAASRPVFSRVYSALSLAA